MELEKLQYAKGVTSPTKVSKRRQRLERLEVNTHSGPSKEALAFAASLAAYESQIDPNEHPMKDAAIGEGDEDKGFANEISDPFILNIITEMQQSMSIAATKNKHKDKDKTGKGGRVISEIEVNSDENMAESISFLVACGAGGGFASMCSSAMGRSQNPTPMTPGGTNREANSGRIHHKHGKPHVSTPSARGPESSPPSSSSSKYIGKLDDNAKISSPSFSSTIQTQPVSDRPPLNKINIMFRRLKNKMLLNQTDTDQAENGHGDGGTSLFSPQPPGKVSKGRKGNRSDSVQWEHEARMQRLAGGIAQIFLHQQGRKEKKNKNKNSDQTSFFSFSRPQDQSTTATTITVNTVPTGSKPRVLTGGLISSLRKISSLFRPSDSYSISLPTPTTATTQAIPIISSELRADEIMMKNTKALI
jgi:hypothetical protein